MTDHSKPETAKLVELLDRFTAYFGLGGHSSMTWKRTLCDDGIEMVHHGGDTIFFGDPNHKEPPDRERFDLIVELANAAPDLAAALRAPAQGQPDRRKPHRLMTRKEYAAFTVSGLHVVEHNYDGGGNTAVWFTGDVPQQDAPAQQKLEPVAWRYQLADMRIWHNGVPGEYTDWHWKVSEHEPNAGDGMRNVTPLYAHSASAPPRDSRAQSTLRDALAGLLEIEDARIKTGAFQPNDEAQRRISAARAALASVTPHDSARREAIDDCLRIVAEQRCERGTPWDLCCTTIAEKLRALSEQPNHSQEDKGPGK